MRVLVVGASRGLGLELVRSFVARGVEVVAISRAASSALKAIRTANPRLVTLLPGDVRSQQDLAECAVELRGMALDVVVFNAAIHREQGGEDILECTTEDVLATLDVNAVGAVRTVKRFRPLLAADGQIVLISSDAASLSANQRSTEYGYCMSKAALNMFAQLLQQRERMHGTQVRVRAVHPGWLSTDMGGPNAPDDPALAADEIVSLILTPSEQDAVFTDRFGVALPW